MAARVEHNVEIGGLVYRIVNPEDHPSVIDGFFGFFIEDEPGTKSKGGYKNKRPPQLAAEIQEMINDGVTIIAEDPNNDNFMCGLCISHLAIRGRDDKMKKQTFEDNLKRMPDAEIHAKMEVVCTEHFFPPEFFEKHPDSNMVIDMFCLGVHGNYRKRGIGGHLLDEAMKVGKKTGCDHAVVVASSEYTAYIAKKLGMNLMHTSNWSDYKDPKDPSVNFFPDEIDSSKVTSYCKRLVEVEES